MRDRQSGGEKDGNNETQRGAKMGAEATVVSARRRLGISWGGAGRLLSPSVRDLRVLTSPLRYTCCSLLPLSLSLLASCCVFPPPFTEFSALAGPTTRGACRVFGAKVFIFFRALTILGRYLRIRTPTVPLGFGSRRFRKNHFFSLPPPPAMQSV